MALGRTSGMGANIRSRSVVIVGDEVTEGHLKSQALNLTLDLRMVKRDRDAMALAIKEIETILRGLKKERKKHRYATY